MSLHPSNFEPYDLKSGSQVQITGRTLENAMMFGAAGLTVLSIPPLAAPPRTHQYVVVRVQFDDGAGGTISPGVTYEQVEEPFTGAEGYYLANSYRRDVVSVDFGHEPLFSGPGMKINNGLAVPIGEIPPMPMEGEDPQRIQIVEALVQEIESEVDLSAYDGLAVIGNWEGALPRTNTATHSPIPVRGANEVYDLNVIWLGQPSASSSDHSVRHEMGHNFGARHGSFMLWDTEDPLNLHSQQSWGSTSICEYGDPLTVMGGSNPGPEICRAMFSGLAHWNAAHKYSVLDWFTQDEVKSIESPEDVGQYVLRPISMETVDFLGPMPPPEPNPLHTLRIPRGLGDSLFVEFRYADDDTHDTAEQLGHVHQASVPSRLYFPDHPSELTHS